MIYFIEARILRLIKIGFVGGDRLRDVFSRLRSLQVGSPDKLLLAGAMLGDRGMEKKLHRRFDVVCSHGEWFQPIPELVDLIHKEKFKLARSFLDQLQKRNFDLHVSEGQLLVSPASKLLHTERDTLKVFKPELLVILDPSLIHDYSI